MIAEREIEHRKGMCVDGCWGQEQEQDTTLLLAPWPKHGQEEKMLMRNSFHASPVPTEDVPC